jgi:hypothetical protein
MKLKKIQINDYVLDIKKFILQTQKQNRIIQMLSR